MAFTLVVAAHLFAFGWLAGDEPTASPAATVRVVEVSLLASVPVPASSEPAPSAESGPTDLVAPDAPAPEPERGAEPEPEPEPQPARRLQDVEPAPPTVRPRREARTQVLRRAPGETAAQPGGDGLATPTDVASEPASEPRHDAAYLRNPRPAYPSQARRRGLEGRVVVRAQVAATGDCVNATVSRSSGHPVLDEAAVAAVRQWRFVAASRGGRAVAATVEIPIVFRLED